jgi:hypothetical protein
LPVAFTEASSLSSWTHQPREDSSARSLRAHASPHQNWGEKRSTTARQNDDISPCVERQIPTARSACARSVRSQGRPKRRNVVAALRPANDIAPHRTALRAVG